MTIKKIIGKTHLWLGLSSGLVVFLLGLTGCILAFEDELKDWLYKDKYYVQKSDLPPLPVSKLLPAAQAALGTAHPIKSINVYTEGHRTVAFGADRSVDSAWNYFEATDYSYTAFVDPYTGKVVGIEDSKNEFFRLVLMLHYDLFLESTGKKIIGWSTVAFIVMLITGLVLWWPKNKAAAKQRFWFRWKKSTRWKRKNYDLHNIAGFYALIFALLIALTGLVWAFRSFDNGVQWVFNGGKVTPEEKTFYSDSLHPHKQLAVYDTILADMRGREKADMYYMSVPEQADIKSPVYAYTEWDNSYKWTSYNYDQHNGRILDAVYYKDKLTGEQVRNMNYYIHTGSVWNLPGKILAFLISFICTGLPVTGCYIWLGRRRKAVPVKLKQPAFNA